MGYREMRDRDEGKRRKGGDEQMKETKVGDEGKCFPFVQERKTLSVG